jgi:hypothetical protein
MSNFILVASLTASLLAAGAATTLLNDGGFREPTLSAADPLNPTESGSLSLTGYLVRVLAGTTVIASVSAVATTIRRRLRWHGDATGRDAETNDIDPLIGEWTNRSKSIHLTVLPDHKGSLSIRGRNGGLLDFDVVGVVTPPTTPEQRLLKLKSKGTRVDACFGAAFTHKGLVVTSAESVRIAEGTRLHRPAA